MQFTLFELTALAPFNGLTERALKAVSDDTAAESVPPAPAGID